MWRVFYWNRRWRKGPPWARKQQELKHEHTFATKEEAESWGRHLVRDLSEIQESRVEAE